MPTGGTIDTSRRELIFFARNWNGFEIRVVINWTKSDLMKVCSRGELMITSEAMKQSTTMLGKASRCLEKWA